MDHYAALRDNFLGLQIYPLSLRELFYIKNIPFDIYAINTDRSYQVVLAKHSDIDQYLLLDLLQKKYLQFFILKEDYPILVDVHKHNLTQAMRRSISIKNSIKQIELTTNIITLNLSYLYEDITNDEILFLQYQAVRNLVIYLVQRPEFINQLYSRFRNQHYPYILAHPLVSTIFTIGMLKKHNVYSEKEIESLAIASYFKDIGLSFYYIDGYKTEQDFIKNHEVIKNHAKYSVDILKDRLPITNSQLLLINDHHFYESEEKTTNISGSELIFFIIADIMSSSLTISRNTGSASVYYSLEMIRYLISPTHPDEFKMAVLFFKEFCDSL